MGLAFASLSSCLEDVPVAISEWKPEHAPQATVINSAGNSVPLALDQPVNAGISNSALPVNAQPMMPRTARTIMAYSR